MKNINIKNNKRYGMQRWILTIGFSVLALFSQLVMAVPGDELWQKPNGGNISSSVVIDNATGNTYFGSADKNIYAYDNAGVLLWSFKTGGMVGSSPTLNEDGSVLYAGSHDGVVYALLTADGSELWRFNTGGIVFASPAVGNTQHGYTVIVGSADNNVYAINAASGTERWYFTTGGEVTTSPAFSQGGMVYVGSSDGFLYALDANVVLGDRLKWQFEAPSSGGMYSPVIGKNNFLYVGAFNNTLYSLGTIGPDSNRVRWSTTFSGRIASAPALKRGGSLLSGTMYVATYDDGMLHNINQASGAIRWSYPTGSQIYSSPSVGYDGTIVFGASNNTVYALDPSLSNYGTSSFSVTDLFKWSYTTDAPVVSSPNLDYAGNVYINSTQTYYKLEDNSGGPDTSEWPMFGANSKHSGRISSGCSGPCGAPVPATDDTFVMNRDVTPSILLDVLANDSGSGLVINAISSSANSTTSIESSGLRINYIPNAGFTGLDTFTYDITGSTATVTVSVTSSIEDTDNDFMNDAWEMATFGSLLANGSSDLNGNGLNDYDEYLESLATPVTNLADGDVNGDGTITLADSLLAQRHVLGEELLDISSIARGDLHPVSGDGQITLSDVLLIQQVVMNQPSTVVDSDGDLLPDDWEIANELDPNDATDALIDSEGDGLNNSQERYYGTLAQAPDTDGDGFSDGDEVSVGTNPTDATHYSVKITSTPVTQTKPGAVYNYVLQSNQPDVVYTLEASPLGASIMNNAGTFSIQWTTTITDIGAHTVTVNASVNGIPSDVQTYSLLVNGIAGDVNGDGLLGISDVLLAQRHLLGEIILTAEQLALGDLYPVNAPDGVITISDVLLIQQFVLGGQ